MPNLLISSSFTPLQRPRPTSVRETREMTGKGKIVRVPPAWEGAADTIAYNSETNPPPVVLICGPGNSGKSAFSRVLLVALMERYRNVGYLDTDLGQPEFTIPGCLSLHIINNAPDLSIFCLKTPTRCFFYGDTSPKGEPEAYITNIFSLYDHFIENYHQSVEAYNHGKSLLPLIINTSGWVKGLGYTLLVRMLRYMSPSHVVKVQIRDESKNLPAGKFWLEGNQTQPSTQNVNLIEIFGSCNDSINLKVAKRQNARYMRDLRMMAYFRQCLPRKLDLSSYSDLIYRLASVPPFQFSLSRIKVMNLRFQVLSSEELNSWNGIAFGLAISSLASRSTGVPWCVGFGFVREVDIKKQVAYVITPVSHHILEKVDLLLQGILGIPTGLTQKIRAVVPSYGLFSA